MPVAIFDMDGVLYRGATVLPYAREALARLRDGGWQVFFATNNSSASREDYVRRLTTMALGGDAEHVITSAYATAHYLERLDPRPADVYVVGADGLRNEIRAVGIAARSRADLPGLHPPSEAALEGGANASAMRAYLVGLELPSAPDTVVVGLDLHLTYAALAEALRGLLAGARFVASNKDRAYPVEGRLLPGAGSIVRALEVASEREAICIGKPEPWLFAEAIRRAGADAGEPVVVIGDAPEYDIVAAHRVGATGVLITTGLTESDAVARATGDAVPDHVIDSLEQLFELPELAGL